MRILIVGDSLSFTFAGQTLDQCWHWLLKTSLPQSDVWVRAEPDSRVDTVLAQLRLFQSSLFLFDLVIVQSGIVDSCPRPMPYWVHRFLYKLGNQTLKRLINRNYQTLLHFRRKSWTSEARFRTVVTDIVERVIPTSTVLFIPIVRPCNRLLWKAPTSVAATERYNAIVRETCEAHGAGRAHVLSGFNATCTGEFVLADGHHLTAAGHRMLADHITAFCEDAAPRARAA
jgi:hypothetical protein